MNRFIDDLDQIIEDKNKSMAIYFWLKDNDLLNKQQLDNYNRFRNNQMLQSKEECEHLNVIHAAGLSTCYDCGEEF